MPRSTSRSRSRERERRDVMDVDGRPNEAPQPGDNGEDNPGNNLYVGNLSFKTEDADLEDAFKEFGEISATEVIKDPYSKDSRGFGFVTFVRAEDAQRAADEMQGKTMNGRTLKVEVSRRGRGHTRTPGQYKGPANASTKYGPTGEVKRSPPRGGGGRDRDRGGGGDYGRDRDRYDRRDGGRDYRRGDSRERRDSYRVRRGDSRERGRGRY